MTAEYILSFDPGTINTSYCLLKIDGLRIQDWGLFSIKDSTNEGTCVKLAKKLDSLALTDNRKVIIIVEQQPRVNIKTIMISGFLHMYYTLEKMTEEGKGIVKIVGCHARNKIKYYVPRPGDEPMPERINKLKKGHYKTKQTLVEHCKRVLIHNNEPKHFVDFFNGSKKKDDLSDTYVSACWYIGNNDLV